MQPVVEPLASTPWIQLPKAARLGATVELAPVMEEEEIEDPPTAETEKSA